MTCTVDNWNIYRQHDLCNLFEKWTLDYDRLESKAGGFSKLPQEIALTSKNFESRSDVWSFDEVKLWCFVKNFHLSNLQESISKYLKLLLRLTPSNSFRFSPLTWQCVFFSWFVEIIGKKWHLFITAFGEAALSKYTRVKWTQNIPFQRCRSTERKFYRSPSSLYDVKQTRVRNTGVGAEVEQSVRFWSWMFQTLRLKRTKPHEKEDRPQEFR